MTQTQNQMYHSCIINFNVDAYYMGKELAEKNVLGLKYGKFF